MPTPVNREFPLNVKWELLHYDTSDLKRELERYVVFQRLVHELITHGSVKRHCSQCTLVPFSTRTAS